MSRKTFDLNNIVVTLFGGIGGGGTTAVYNNPVHVAVYYMYTYIIL
jgi:hypothetical protein